MGQGQRRILVLFQFCFDIRQRHPFAGRRCQYVRHDAERLGQRHKPFAEIALGNHEHRLACLHRIHQTHFHRQSACTADCHHMVSLENRFQPLQAFFVNRYERTVGMAIGRAGQGLANRFCYGSRSGNHYQRVLFHHDYTFTPCQNCSLSWIVSRRLQIILPKQQPNSRNAFHSLFTFSRYSTISGQPFSHCPQPKHLPTLRFFKTYSVWSSDCLCTDTFTYSRASRQNSVKMLARNTEGLAIK